MVNGAELIPTEEDKSHMRSGVGMWLKVKKCGIVKKFSNEFFSQISKFNLRIETFLWCGQS